MASTGQQAQEQASISGVTQHKLAERLTFLSDRGQGLLIRLSKIKKKMAFAESRPPFLNDKVLEPSIKALTKKFPVLDKKSTAALALVPRKDELELQVSAWYNAFVDIMNYKSDVDELLSRIDSCQLYFDITLNFDLTKAYLDVIVCYISLLIVLSRTEERKTLICVYELSQSEAQTQSKKTFPRLAQLFVDYDDPIRKLAEDFVPHTRCIAQALASLRDPYEKRVLRAEDWRTLNIFSLLAEPLKMGDAALSPIIQCEYLSSESMDKWIILGYLVCNSLLADDQNLLLYKRALSNSFAISLCRDEVLQPHNYSVDYFQSSKLVGSAKRISEIKDWYSAALASIPGRGERRKYMTTALRELHLMLTDQPGLLGPKALLVFSSLCFARDEVNWLLRHHENAPLKKGTDKPNTEGLDDRQLPELLFFIEELRSMVRKYAEVIQRYHISFLSDYDAFELVDYLKATTFSAAETATLNALANDLMQLRLEDVQEGAIVDLRGFRLDWMRLQACMSTERSQRPLKEHRRLAELLNTTAFHSKMVDYLEETLFETSSLSLYYSYLGLLQAHFKQCAEFPPQIRYIIAFPMIATHFIDAYHDVCPEELDIIGSAADQCAELFVVAICGEACELLFRKVCEQQNSLDEKLLPKYAVNLMVQSLKRKKEKTQKKTLGTSLAQLAQPTTDGAATSSDQFPGAESTRKDRNVVTVHDKGHNSLVELCAAINHTPYIEVHKCGVLPVEKFVEMLEGGCIDALERLACYDASAAPLQIIRPSEVLQAVKTITSMVQTLEGYVQIDVPTLLRSALSHQSRLRDDYVGNLTYTAHFISFYFDLLHHTTMMPIVVSPVQRAFITVTSDMLIVLHSTGVVKSSVSKYATINALSSLALGPTKELPAASFAPIIAEHFTSYTEMQALVDLLGPLGVQVMQSRISNYVADHLDKAKVVVMRNRDLLRELRKSYTQPGRMRELSQKLQGIDVVFQQLTTIGMLLSFRRLVLAPLKQMLEKRMPLLCQSISEFANQVVRDPNAATGGELIATAGFELDGYPFLQAEIRRRLGQPNDEDHEICSLLLVFIAVCLPRLALNEGSVYLPQFGGHLNNIHCLAISIDVIAGELFRFHAKNDLLDRLIEFLSLASTNVLHLGQDSEESGATKNIESLYILLDLIVQESTQLSPSIFEKYFPYSLVRNAYSAMFRTVNVDLTNKPAK